MECDWTGYEILPKDFAEFFLMRFRKKKRVKLVSDKKEKRYLGHTLVYQAKN